jgi:maltooligosyltrehalose trehalohydrolase
MPLSARQSHNRHNEYPGERELQETPNERMKQRQHLMRFSAQTLEDGGVRFALWAPAAKSVSVCFEGPGTQRQLEMPRQPDGWYELSVAEAGAGMRYRYLIDGQTRVPDPASRFQPDDVHGASEVIDPSSFDWRDPDWQGRSWEEVVLYELHVGTFTPAGTFAAIEERLDHLVDLGVTAIELMPVADFPGTRNWGYDGVLPFAPDSAYGRPEDLKNLVQTAHAKGLMVFLDVVYNHFGPDGNYLYCYAPDFFTDRHHTPWGAAINFDGRDSATVRQFFIHNALYWLEEYHFDGLRLDAVHAILDDSEPDILEELANTVTTALGAERHIHLVLENDDNAAHYLRRGGNDRSQAYVAQWNDDIHHALHVLATGDTGGYYTDYSENPARHLGRCLTEGFAYQGDPSPYRQGKLRGEPTEGIPITAFVSFLQNHDQVGNRAFGERITALAPEAAVRAVTAIMLLAPSPPMLFMGQEWGAPQPFLFFCDFGPELAKAVTEGRRREFERFPEFADPAARERIPDPSDPKTYQATVLDWSKRNSEAHVSSLAFHRQLLHIRQREITPRIIGMRANRATVNLLAERALQVQWTLSDRSRLSLLANVGDRPVAGPAMPPGRVLFQLAASSNGVRAPWSVVWCLATDEQT